MLKVGVLGAGHLGKIHIRLLLELSDKYEFVGFLRFSPQDILGEFLFYNYFVNKE